MKSNKIMNGRYGLLAGLATMISMAGTAVAAPALEEVVVTAQKRTQSMQDVPVAVSAVTSADMADGRVNFNLAVSNVPGPAEECYLMGARLEAVYPVSVVTHGQILNITCTSYAGTLNFGVVACRDGLQHVQRIAVYIGEALEELERECAIYNPKETGGESRPGRKRKEALQA